MRAEAKRDSDGHGGTRRAKGGKREKPESWREDRRNERDGAWKLVLQPEAEAERRMPGREESYPNIPESEIVL